MTSTIGRGVKHPLARALHQAGLTVVDVAAELEVDPKTVHRWFTGRVPLPRHRAALRRLTGQREQDLWPQLAPPPVAPPPADEVRTVYPHRSAVPPQTWRQLFRQATTAIDIVAYSCLFLMEDTAVLRLLRDRAAAGVRVRLALGDPDGRQVARRGGEERIDDVLRARIRNALLLGRDLTRHPSVEVRLHDTVLYNSIYRADDELLVNTHSYGCPAARAPVLHLRRRADDQLAAHYLQSVQRIWDHARTVVDGHDGR